jgi:electron transport complex protein RnfB
MSQASNPQHSVRAEHAGAATLPDAAAIDALLPQTQCTRCGFPGCRPYAEAIARGEADINQCPPGGTAVIEHLAELLGRAPKPLDPTHGSEGPAQIARIDEHTCIGCAKCLPPCPVDAIIGARKHMHTVVTALCTGCGLCIAPCPVDCITLAPRATSAAAPPAPTPADNRSRYRAHNDRADRRARKRAQVVAARKQWAGGPPPCDP